MLDLLTFENLFNLLVLLFLQAVLGFDNLLYISIESRRAPEHLQARVRRAGILIAIGLRIVLLFVMIQLLEALSAPFHVLRWEGVLEGGVNFATVVFLFGGAFIMYTAVKEISHLLAIEDLHEEEEEASKDRKSAASVVALIVFMNLIFSFDSILSALAITDVFVVLAIAILASGLAMLLLADRVASFIESNRSYEVLGLFILLIVGVVLLGEAGPAAAHGSHREALEGLPQWLAPLDAVYHAHIEALEIKLFGFPIEPMSKTTFYFSIAVLVAINIIQSRYQKKLAAERRRLRNALPKPAE